jgi:hypothetical protein
MSDWKLAPIAMGLAGLLAAACTTTGDDAASQAGATAVSMLETSAGQLAGIDAVEITATVEAVDQKTRMVTLRGPEGNLVSFRAAEEVRNLPQLRVGDRVRATYYEAIAVQVRGPGEATPGVSAGEVAGRAEPGEKPGALRGRSVTVTTTVQAIDREKQKVTLKTPEGLLQPIAVRDPRQLEELAVGDLVEITYTEALAISVEEPGAD